MKTNQFVRKLASNDRKTREKAFDTLQTYLVSRSHSRKLTSLELKKLWKGLYYTMWFSDRPLPQKKLATKMAALFSDAVSDEQFGEFVKAFWYVMDKQWTEIDRWRVDKYLLLMRYVVRDCFVKIRKSGYDEKLIASYTDALEEGILSGSLKHEGYLMFHIVDTWVDGIEQALIEDKKEEEVIPWDMLMGPLKRLTTLDTQIQKGLKSRINEMLNDRRFPEWGYKRNMPKVRKVKKMEAEEDEDREVSGNEKKDDNEEEGEWTGFGDD